MAITVLEPHEIAAELSKQTGLGWSAVSGLGWSAVSGLGYCAEYEDSAGLCIRVANAADGRFYVWVRAQFISKDTSAGEYASTMTEAVAVAARLLDGYVRRVPPSVSMALCALSSSVEQVKCTS